MTSQVVEVQGLKELDRKLKKLPELVQKKVIRAALMSGSLPMTKDAKARVRSTKGTGNLRDQVRRRSKKTVKGFLVQIYVREGKSLGKLDAYYWRFQHFVSAKNLGAKGGSGGTRNPFLSDAFDAGHKSTLTNSVRQLRKGIDKQQRLLSK